MKTLLASAFAAALLGSAAVAQPGSPYDHRGGHSHNPWTLHHQAPLHHSGYHLGHYPVFHPAPQQVFVPGRWVTYVDFCGILQVRYVPGYYVTVGGCR